MDFCFIGGDKRMESAAYAAGRDGFSVSRYLTGGGSEQRGSPPDFREIFSVENPRAAVFPFPLLNKEGDLNQSVSPPLDVSEIVSALPKTTRIFGGKIPTEYLKRWSEEGRVVTDYGAAEQLLAENAALTAEGAVMEGLQAGVEYGSSKRTTVLTVGYGRIGKALLPRLTSLGCRVLTAERRQDRREEAAQICGMAIPIEDLGRVRADAIFNTVPSRVIPPSLIRDSIYIELASAPFGISPQEGREIARVYRPASGLPGKYAPYRAGLALWNYLRSEWEATV